MIGSYLFMKSLNTITLLKDKQTRSWQSSVMAVFVEIFFKIKKLNSKGKFLEFWSILYVMIRNTIPKTSTCGAQWNRIDFADGIFTESCFKVVINRPIPWLRDALFLSRNFHPFVCMHAYLLPTTKSLQIFRKIQISGTDDHFLLVFIALDLLLLRDQLITIEYHWKYQFLLWLRLSTS